MSAHTSDRVHPVLEHVLTLADFPDVPTWTMSVAEQKQALVSLARVEAQVKALQLRLLAEADANGVGDDVAAASAADWVAIETRQVRQHARADLKLAKRLEDLHVLASAFASGQVNRAQSQTIVRALDLLPDEVDPTEAEAHLVELAGEHDAAALARLGRHIFEVLAPEEADRREGELLARQEAAALRKTEFWMSFDEDGVCHFRGRVPAQHGHRLQALLHKVHDPKTPANPHQRGLAFCTVLEDKVHTTLVVTITEENLLEGLGAAQLDTGGAISAGEARRLACTAAIIPVVLGGASVPLDVGRKRRFHTQPQRIAMMLRDGPGCTAQGCDKPIAFCHAHHDTLSWANNGGTSVERGRMLCGHHHRRIHDASYDHQTLPNGKITFHRRT